MKKPVIILLILFVAFLFLSCFGLRHDNHRTRPYSPYYGHSNSDSVVQTLDSVKNYVLTPVDPQINATIGIKCFGPVVESKNLNLVDSQPKIGKR